MSNPPRSAPGEGPSRVLEAYLSYGTIGASEPDVLMIRRARGFALIGLLSLFLGGIVAPLATGTADLVPVSAGMMVVLMVTVGLGFFRNGRFVRPLMQSGLGMILVGLAGVSLHIGYINPVSSSFPILLVMAATYVLGVRAAFFWALASVLCEGLTVYALDLPQVPDGAMSISKLGVFSTASVVLLGVYGMAATERHFSDQRRAELDFLARHDPLTGLLNRRALEEHLGETRARCERHGRRFAILVVDLDGFKSVNDAHGHSAGDALLAGLAERIAKMTRETDRACRVGGDEFVVVLEDVADDKAIALTAERLLGALTTPMKLAEVAVQVGVSIGVAVYPDATPDASKLTKLADLAMYEAKIAGGSAMRFHGSPDLAAGPIELARVSGDLAGYLGGQLDSTPRGTSPSTS